MGHSAEAVGNQTVSVSYDMPAERFYVAASSVDPRYGQGLPFDLYLRFKYGLRQQPLCAGGYRSGSHYLVREDRPVLPSRDDQRLELHADSVPTRDWVVLNRERDFSLLWRP